jgi:hypothetical protein
MPAKFKTLEVWVAVDADGDYECGVDEDAATERFDENVGGTGGRRLVKLTVKVPLPTVIELTGEVEADPEPGELRAV